MQSVYKNENAARSLEVKRGGRRFFRSVLKPNEPRTVPGPQAGKGSGPRLVKRAGVTLIVSRACFPKHGRGDAAEER